MTESQSDAPTSLLFPGVKERAQRKRWLSNVVYPLVFRVRNEDGVGLADAERV